VRNPWTVLILREQIGFAFQAEGDGECAQPDFAGIPN
jgi:hypothetical protein